MTDIERAALLLRRAVSNKELAGELKEHDAVVYIELLTQLEQMLTK